MIYRAILCGECGGAYSKEDTKIFMLVRSESKITSMCLRARKRIILIDNYIDETALTLLNKEIEASSLLYIQRELIKI